MPLKHIYLDMDGVLVDFHHGFQQLCGIENPIKGHEWPPEKTLHDHVGYDWNTCRKLSREAPAGFWANMAPLPLALIIAKECLAFAAKHKLALSLLTDTSNSHYASLGKMQWLVRHLPELAARCCLTTDKDSFAYDDCLLIDDTPAVAVAFSKAGGRAIVIPQCWNNWKFAYGTPGRPDITDLLRVARDYEEDKNFLITDMESYGVYSA